MGLPIVSGDSGDGKDSGTAVLCGGSIGTQGMGRTVESTAVDHCEPM